MEERAAALKKQNTEDAALAMKEVLRTKAEVLTGKLRLLFGTFAVAIKVAIVQRLPPETSPVKSPATPAGISAEGEGGGA